MLVPTLLTVIGLPKRRHVRAVKELFVPGRGTVPIALEKGIVRCLTTTV